MSALMYASKNAKNDRDIVGKNIVYLFILIFREIHAELMKNNELLLLFFGFWYY